MTAPANDNATSRVTRAFVDSIENDIARLIINAHVLKFPAVILPAGVCEGQWIEIQISQARSEDPDTIDAKRKQIAEKDDGNDIKL